MTSKQVQGFDGEPLVLKHHLILRKKVLTRVSFALGCVALVTIGLLAYHFASLSLGKVGLSHLWGRIKNLWNAHHILSNGQLFYEVILSTAVGVILLSLSIYLINRWQKEKKAKKNLRIEIDLTDDV